MLRLDDVRAQWIELRARYEQLGKHVETQIRRRLRTTGIPASVSSRTKTVDSFLKKAIRKGYADALDDTHDKVGVRIVVPFITQVQKVDSIIRDAFDVRIF